MMVSSAEKEEHLMKSFPSISKIRNPDRTGWALQRMFDDLAERIIPNSEYTLPHLIRFMRSLVRAQRGVGRFIVEPGSWSLISLDEGEPSDVRVDYIFFPTYYAVSMLTLFLQRFPEQTARIKGYREALHRGYRFAGMRGLWGHGIEGGEQREQAVEILLRGGVPEYLRDNAKDCSECRPLLNAILDYAAALEKRIDPKIIQMYLRLSDLKILVPAANEHEDTGKNGHYERN